jgi:hypothetical protein
MRNLVLVTLLEMLTLFGGGTVCALRSQLLLSLHKPLFLQGNRLFLVKQLYLSLHLPLLLLREHA